jgi:hypothetical protein
LGAWDIIGVGSTDFALVQVKTRDWPAWVEIESLKSFPAPPETGSQIADRQDQPT